MDGGGGRLILGIGVGRMGDGVGVTVIRGKVTRDATAACLASRYTYLTERVQH